MIQALRRIFAIPELKEKIKVTLLLLLACRIGTYISVPGINSEHVVSLFKYASGGGQNLFQLVDIFSGGAFAKMTVLALGVMPYITSTIILQVLIAAVPSLQREIRESPDQGKRKLSKWTRLGTLLIASIQSFTFAKFVLSIQRNAPGIIIPEVLDVQLFGFSWLYYLIVVVTMTAGTLFLMWVGEQITEKGVGNGISLIISTGILASFPGTIGSIIQKMNLTSQQVGQISLTTLSVLSILFVLIIIGTILIIQGQRRIPLQYARRIVGRHEVQGGGNSHIPLKLNHAGVIPVIFASAFLMVPASIGQFLGKNTWFGQFTSYITPGAWTYLAIYVLLIFMFTYFWTATQFRPDQIASDMKKNGAFIPGIRPGKQTQDFIEGTMNRITLAGATFLALIAILPNLVGRLLGVDPNISQFFGGTSLLILVGVILDTTKQIESHLLMKKYEGFMSRGRLRGR
jgi:preprotein translocase subunit SecY